VQAHLCLQHHLCASEPGAHVIETLDPTVLAQTMTTHATAVPMHSATKEGPTSACSTSCVLVTVIRRSYTTSLVGLRPRSYNTALPLPAREHQLCPIEPAGLSLCQQTLTVVTQPVSQQWATASPATVAVFLPLPAAPAVRQ
jgi:hypothetical protein